MAGISQPIADVKARIHAMAAITNKDGAAWQPIAKIWNNQLAYLKDGKLNLFATPAFYVEIIPNALFEVVGMGVRSTDITFQIHCVDEFLNEEGVENENTIIFELRDKVTKQLSMFKPAGCGSMVAIGEAQDYDHSNVYHYIITFVCNFMDDTASKENLEGLIWKQPPTEGEIVPQVTTGEGQKLTTKFKMIPKWPGQ